MSAWEDFVNYYGLKSRSADDRIVELIGKFSDALGRPIEREEFSALLRLTYPGIDEQLGARISKALQQARKRGLESVPVREFKRMTGISISDHLFVKELERKTQRRLSRQARGSLLRGISVRDIIAEKKRMKATIRAVFLIKDRRQAAEQMRIFWSWKE